MEKKCLHKWVALYYRKVNKITGNQEWIKIKDQVVCKECLKRAWIKDD